MERIAVAPGAASVNVSSTASQLLPRNTARSPLRSPVRTSTPGTVDPPDRLNTVTAWPAATAAATTW